MDKTERIKILVLGDDFVLHPVTSKLALEKNNPRLKIIILYLQQMSYDVKEVVAVKELLQAIM